MFYFINNLELLNIEDGDWILAYNDGVLVGSRQWEGIYTDIPAMGNDGTYSTVGYMEDGNVPTFKLVDSLRWAWAITNAMLMVRNLKHIKVCANT